MLHRMDAPPHAQLAAGPCRLARAAVCAAISIGLCWVLGAGIGCGRSSPRPGEPIPVRIAFGEVGASPGQFSYPRAMDAQVDPAGAWLWVVDKLGRVQKIDARTGQCAAWWRMPEIVLGKPTGITIGPAAGPGLSAAERAKQAVWLADTHYHQILVYDPEDVGSGPSTARAPRVLGRFGSYGEGPGQLVYPTDVALLLDGDGLVERVYIAEYGGNDRITCLDADFNVLFTFGRFGSSESPDLIEFNRPQSIGIDHGLGELIVADSCNHRIGRFTLDGGLIGWLGCPDTPGTEPGQFRYPWGVHVPGDGTVLVVELQGARVQHLDLRTGQCLGLYGRVGFGAGELVTPWAVTMIDRRAFVLDSGNNRVMGFDPARSRSIAGPSVQTERGP